MSKIKKTKPASTLIVTQSNKLVEARYILSLGEQRLILSMISQIQPDDEDFKEYRVSISELAEFIGIDKNHAYEECKKTTESLTKRGLIIEEPGRLLQTIWVSSAEYMDGDGCVKLCFDPKLKPYLLKLKGNFTSSNLGILLSFRSQYTMRMYNFLKQYEKLKERDIELNKFRQIFGIEKEQYKKYNDLKRFVLQPIKSELFKKSDLYFDFDEIKYGRKVGAIRFHIFTKKLTPPTDSTVEPIHPELSPLEVNTSPTLFDQLLLLVPDQHRTKKTVISSIEVFEKKHCFDYVKRNILYCNAKAEKSYAGFLNQSLQNDWGQDWELDQKTPVKMKVKPKEVWQREGYASESEYAQAMFDKQMAAYRK